ncbi:MAG TPA: ABC transporter ATP-binding protein [Candidatus Hydrogenedentes bacterium]|nr:ABC transporter ATP-binding protein [Candidatus Hydrogenedentota bacterium]HIJ72703.1 ABC transporter ATP-binding protein [Candidatus Hydrogenedentota bacterium]
MRGCIKTENLTKCYGRTVAVGGLSLEVDTGEVFGLLGPNGAGKSTTLYMLAGLVPPTSGSISIFGKDRRKRYLDVASRMGVLVEHPTFYDYLSARANLLLVTKLANRHVSVDRVLDLVGLLDEAKDKVGTFSSGMRQRLGLAQALVTEPELLVLDEPTNGLDVEGTHEILELLRRLAAESNVTIVVSSHMLHEVETLCDRVAVINKGRLVSCSPMDTLLSYDQTDVEVLLDAPEAAARRLALESWVESAEVEPGRLRVRIREANAHQLTAFLVSGGYRVSGVIPRRRTLHDYFLRVLNR